MGLDLGIVGLPNVGKSTLFQAITAQQVDAANYPFCTIEPNKGTVKVPDERLDLLQKIFSAPKIVHNVVNIVDIAGLVKGASAGEGLGNQFLGHIRQVDAILEVVRCFENTDITHVENSVNPQRDIATIHNELIIADLQTLEQNIERFKKLNKSSNKLSDKINFMLGLQQHLYDGQWAKSFDVPEDMQMELKTWGLLTAKPFFLVLNLDENMSVSSETEQAIQQLAQKLGVRILKISAKLESEIAGLDETEKKEVLSLYGLKKAGLTSIIEQGFDLLKQITFFTAGKKEVRAWHVKKDSFLPQAAGKIHSDMERGFIKAEVYNFNDLLTHKSESALRSNGKIRLEGKSYKIQEGDVINIRFAV